MKQTHCCGARPTRPLRLSFSQAAPKIPCFLCVFASSAARKWAQKGALGRFRGESGAQMWTKCGRNVDEVLTQCGVWGGGLGRLNRLPVGVDAKKCFQSGLSRGFLR